MGRGGSSSRRSWPSVSPSLVYSLHPWTTEVREVFKTDDFFFGKVYRQPEVRAATRLAFQHRCQFAVPHSRPSLLPDAFLRPF